MKSYFFEIAGIKIKLNSAEKISMTEKLIPFFREKNSEKEECELSIELCENLPQRALEGIWRGFTFYSEGTEKKYFHYETLDQEPYAVTTIEGSGKICLQYTVGGRMYVEDSSGVFRHIGLETLLIMHKRMILHSSFIKYKEKAILFSAPSGTGKSTQAELWKTGRGADIINGDRTALVRENDCWRAWGIPYAGTSGIYRNESAPVGAVIVLRQGTENSIRKIGGVEAFSCLYPEVNVHHWDLEYVNVATDLIRMLIEEVPIFLLECVAEESAVDFLEQILQKEKILC